MRRMKDSKITWVGDIPDNWITMPNKRIMHKQKDICEKYNGEDILSLTMKGVIVRDFETGGKVPATFDGYQIIKPNNLLMCLFDYDVTPRCIGIIENYGLTSPAYSQFVIDKGNVPKYYYYYYLMVDNTKELLHLAKNLRHSFTEEQLGEIYVPVPPIDEQNKIVKFLDEKLIEIDNVLEKTKETIDDYKKYKQSIITETVTKGLDKTVEMKNSNIPWIGVIPKDWKVLKIKNILAWKSEKNHGGEQVLSLYRDFGVVPKDSRDDNHNVTSEDTNSYKLVEIGDFVINKMKAWQGSMAVSNYRGIISPAYHVCKFTDRNINKKYFHYLLRNQLYLPEFRRLSTGLRIGQWDLGFEDFKNLTYILPSNHEQEIIVQYLDKRCGEIDMLIEAKENIISELEQYKKSVIYEYVTGKKEVK